jgi:catalase-peroxidase
MGEPDVAGAAATIRDVFGRMDWKGRELVALIGGGHTFGKAHGASTASPGDPPNKCPFAPWNGNTGMEAVTSGFEGAWTENPIQWDNKYFQYLVNFEWEPIVGPGGHHQWRVKGGNGPKSPVADPSLNQTQDVMMLTTDVALMFDPEYQVYVREFASNLTALSEAFAKAWYKLVTRDVGPVERCLGPKVPPAQHFQHPLPPFQHSLADMDDVAHDVRKLMHKNKDDGLEMQFFRLAFHCASTFRATDYQGGCNGARIRFSPAKDWPINAGLTDTLALLEPIKEKYGKHLSYADLIVLAGTTAAEELGAPKMEFCPGRSDAEDGRGWSHLEYGLTDYPSTVEAGIELCHRRGQTLKECVALTFPVYQSSGALADMLSKRSSTHLMEEGLIFHPELRYWADHYVSVGTKVYAEDFAQAWTRLMNADRFKGPLGNVCA